MIELKLLMTIATHYHVIVRNKNYCVTPNCVQVLGLLELCIFDRSWLKAKFNVFIFTIPKIFVLNKIGLFYQTTIKSYV